MRAQCQKMNSRERKKTEVDGVSLFSSHGEKNVRPKNSFYHVISEIYLCKKFIAMLLRATSLRRPKWLNNDHFQLINDKACFYENQTGVDGGKIRNKGKLFKCLKKAKGGIAHCLARNRLLTFLKQEIRSVLNFLGENTQIFDPNRNFTIIWDFLVMFLILFFFVIIPLEIAFSEMVELIPDEYKIYGVFVFVLDALKSLNTAYYHKGILVVNRKEVIKNYIFKRFLVDIVTLIPLMLAYNFESDQSCFGFVNMLFYFKYHHFKRIQERVEELIFLNENLVSLAKLIFRILLFTHIFACAWYFIGSLSSNSWIDKIDLEHKGWFSLYINAFYFIIVTMNTVGYGDIAPANNFEIAFVILFILVGCGLFAVNLNQIGVILRNISRKSTECKRELNLINHFMLEKNVTFELKMKIRKYLQYIWNEEKLEELSDQFKIVNKLSDSLKDELLLEANGPFLRDLKLFNLNFSEETLRQTVKIMIEKRYTPGDLVFSQNETENKSLFIIRKGEIELFYETESNFTSMKKLLPGEIFGETSFFSDRARSFCARSLDFSNVFEIKKEDFFRILQRNRRDMERFCQIKDNINLYEDYGDLYLKCASCRQASHRVKECPLLHYIPNKEIVILKHLYSSEQIRCECVRKKKKVKTFANMKKIKTKACLYQKMNLETIESEESEEAAEKKEKEESKNHYEELVRSVAEFRKSKTSKEEKILDRDYNEEMIKESFNDKSMKNISRLRTSVPKYERLKTENKTSYSTFHNIDKNKECTNEPNSNKSFPAASDISLKQGKLAENELCYCLVMDRVKCFDLYFPEDNVDQVLARIASFKLRKKKAKSTKTFKKNRSSFESVTNTFRKQSIEKMKDGARNPFQKEFFKAKKFIDKMIEEEEFNPEKIKKVLREKLRKKKTMTESVRKIGNIFSRKRSKVKIAKKKSGIKRSFAF